MKSLSLSSLIGEAEDILERAARRRQQALVVLGKLGLMERWSSFGQPRIVGAVRYGLVVALDIDIAIYAEYPQISHGFQVVSAVVELPGVWKVRYSNELTRPDEGLYWQIRYQAEDGNVWKVDNWLLSKNHPQADRDDQFASTMERALTPEKRRAILTIKEALSGQDGVRGIDIYQAVLDGGVHTPQGFQDWLLENHPSALNYWMPSGNQITGNG
jgi:hypothetical protein